MGYLIVEIFSIANAHQKSRNKFYILCRIYGQTFMKFYRIYISMIVKKRALKRFNTLITELLPGIRKHTLCGLLLRQSLNLFLLEL